MMYRNIFIIVGLLMCYLFTSCVGGVFYIDLGNHYAWLEDRIIYKIKEESEKGLYGDVIIRPQVLNYNYDDQYIIVYQIYDGDDFFYDISAKQDKAEKDSLYAQFDKIKKIKYCYWIIDKETDQVIGPLRKDDFDRKCQELHIEIKMHRFHEKKFWENRSMKELGIDSADVVRKEAD
ncbi:MAG: DUF3997 domain-containing protein, partial [Prevotella sp.]|nr:DUF3997 domain-containing protein [Prevotella sp.]